MDIEKLHSSLDNETISNTQRQELIAYLKASIDTLPEDEGDRRTVAYEIAGLLSTHFAKSLDSHDTLDEILTLAGELEVPDENDAGKWAEFYKLIQKL